MDDSRRMTHLVLSALVPCLFSAITPPPRIFQTYCRVCRDSTVLYTFPQGWLDSVAPRIFPPKEDDDRPFDYSELYEYVFDYEKPINQVPTALERRVQEWQQEQLLAVLDQLDNVTGSRFAQCAGTKPALCNRGQQCVRDETTFRITPRREEEDLQPVEMAVHVFTSQCLLDSVLYDHSAEPQSIVDACGVVTNTSVPNEDCYCSQFQSTHCGQGSAALSQLLSGMTDAGVESAECEKICCLYTACPNQFQYANHRVLNISGVWEWDTTCMRAEALQRSAKLHLASLNGFVSVQLLALHPPPPPPAPKAGPSKRLARVDLRLSYYATIDDQSLQWLQRQTEHFLRKGDWATEVSTSCLSGGPLKVNSGDARWPPPGALEVTLGLIRLLLFS